MSISKAVEEDQERFAKCCLIISHNCNSWVLTFAQNRIKQDHGKTLIEFINSSPDLTNDKIVKEFLKMQTTSSSSEIDILPLCVVIKTGKLLQPGVPGKLKSVWHQNNTIGDQIDRILEIRNTLMLTAEPHLDECNYDDHINELKDIGRHFEVINGEMNDTYKMEIDKIHDASFTTRKVESIVKRHKQYVETARNQDLERFAKCLMIISHNCKLWILKFVENRIQQDHGKTLIEFINSSPDLTNDKIVKEFLKMQTPSSSSEIDILPLCVVIKTGKLLMCGVSGELNSVGHRHNTTGDQIDRILEIQNTFMHTAEPHLDECDYDDHINELKDIGKRFEEINDEKKDTYTVQIKVIHDTIFDISKVKDIVRRHKECVEMVIKEYRERFEKCFVIISENCKQWILKFVENRIRQDYGNTLIKFITSSPDLRNHKIVKQFLKSRKTSLSSERDISALCVVIKTGKLLKTGKCGERKSAGHQYNTIGDQIDRIREIWYTFMHTAEPNFHAWKYYDHINDFKDIGKRFEVINGEKKGTYTMQIKEIHDTIFDISKVESIATRHKLYVEMVIKEDRERFAKCFVIISENCKSWILKFVQNRIQQDHGKNLIQFITSSPDLLKNTIVKEFLKSRKKFISSEIDISALWAVITIGKLLKRGVHGELKSVGHQYNTTGDQIDRIREIRNSFMHTADANLDESDYDDYIKEFKDIGKRFEVINGESNGTYTIQIKEIHDTLFDTRNVERIVVRYKTYVDIVQRIEMPALVQKRVALVEDRVQDACTGRMPCYFCLYRHPIDCQCDTCRPNN